MKHFSLGRKWKAKKRKNYIFLTDYEDNEDVSEEAEAKVVGYEDEDEEYISENLVILI